MVPAAVVGAWPTLPVAYSNLLLPLHLSLSLPSLPPGDAGHSPLSLVPHASWGPLPLPAAAGHASSVGPASEVDSRTSHSAIAAQLPSSPSLSYYLKAVQLAPKSGRPYNQLAVIAINAVSH